MSNNASDVRCYYCTDADIARVAATLKVELPEDYRAEIDDAFQAYFSVSETEKAQPVRSDVREAIGNLGTMATVLGRELRRVSDYDPCWTEVEKQRNSAILDTLLFTPGFVAGAYTDKSGDDATFHQFDTLIDMLARFAGDCSTALAAEKPVRRGPKGYPGFNVLLWKLAEVYERLNPALATVTWNPYEALWGGRFMDFVVACLHPLSPENALSNAALGGRIKRTLDERRGYLESRDAATTEGT